MSKPNSLHKVIIRTRDGEVVPGFAEHKHVVEEVWVIDRQGRKQSFELKDIKAVFFVNDFTGDREYKDIHFLRKQTGSTAVWVRVKFFDGEQLEGRIENTMQILSGDGFFLWPSDSETNNKCVYICKEALVDFQILLAD